jgi:uncharacterized protein
MSIGFQPQIPLSLDSEDGFAMIKDLKSNIKQNLKMLLLTNPGERIMLPRFGVGMRKYLFETSGDDVYAQIDARIREQVSIFLPYLQIKRIKFSSDNENKISLTIFYSVPRISLNDVLTTEVL